MRYERDMMQVGRTLFKRVRQKMDVERLVAEIAEASHRTTRDAGDMRE